MNMEGILRMSGKKQQVKIIFDSIAYRYDFLNHLLSFGFDYYWRKKALKLTGLDRNTVLLDIACGTGDVAIEARKHSGKCGSDRCWHEAHSEVEVAEHWPIQGDASRTS